MRRTGVRRYGERETGIKDHEVVLDTGRGVMRTTDTDREKGRLRCR